MAQAFRNYPIEEFPILEEVGQALSTGRQSALPEGLGEDDSIHSEMSFLGHSEHREYSKYRVQHERLKNMRVRFQNTFRDSVIVVIEISLFVRGGGQYLWVKKPKYVEEFFKRLKGIRQDFEFTPRTIDLARMEDDLSNDVTGGWFRDLTVANVSSAGIFGEGVARSSDWERYEGAGRISALTINTETNFGELTFQVTHEGTIVLYSNFAERLALEIVDHVNEIVSRYEVATP